MALSPLNQRRWNNFRRNKRAFWSFWIFSVLFVLSLFAEFIANDKPILVSYRGELFMPIFKFYPETAFGGDFRTSRGGGGGRLLAPKGVGIVMKLRRASAFTGVVRSETGRRGSFRGLAKLLPFGVFRSDEVLRGRV